MAPAAKKARRNPNRLCFEGGDVHTWDGTGLDVNADGVLCTTRSCLRCDQREEKPHGGKRRGWTVVRGEE